MIEWWWAAVAFFCGAGIGVAAMYRLVAFGFSSGMIKRQGEARTFIEVRGVKRPINEFDPEDSDFHFESSQEWLCGRRGGNG